MAETTRRQTFIIIAAFLIGVILAVVGIYIYGFEKMNISISNPPAIEQSFAQESVSPEYSKLLGSWKGKWAEGNVYFELPASLFITSVKDDGTLSGTYAWGGNSFIKMEPGSTSFTSKLSNNVFSINLPSGAHITFLVQEGALMGSYQSDIQNTTSSIKMERVAS